MTKIETISRFAAVGALALSQFVATSAFGETKIPGLKLTAPTSPPNVIDYPDCPAGFFLTQKGAHIFNCRALAPGVNDLPQLVNVAEATPCEPASDWDGPTVKAYIHNSEFRVDFRCMYNP